MQLKHLFSWAVLSAVVVLGTVSCSDDPERDNSNVVDFESITTGSGNVTSMVDGDNPITANGFTFHGTQTTSTYNGQTYVSWDGFRVSSSTSTSFVADPNDPNNYANSCVGHGYNGSKNFAVYYPAYNSPATVDVPSSADYVLGFYGAVNTYVEHSILNGDSYARAFKQGDWLRLDCIGVKEDGTTTTLSYYLVDYRSSNASEHYYLKDWTWFDLYALGKVKQIYFAFDGSDKVSYDGGKTYYLNTPTYVLIDDFNGYYDGKARRAVEATK